jgi:hypothetical protein
LIAEAIEKTMIGNVNPKKALDDAALEANKILQTPNL